MAVVAPMSTFRLLMVRAVAVLATTVPLALAASLAMPSFGMVTVAWLLPALALISLGLALMPWLGPLAAPMLVGGGWVGALLLDTAVSHGALFLFTAAGRLATGAAALAAIATLTAVRGRFDSGRARPPFRFGFPFTPRRLS
jgi:hypothetical protein